MKNFVSWYERRLIEDSEPADAFRFNSSSEVEISGDFEMDLKEIMKILMNRYQSEMMSFLEGLSERDPELRDLLKKIQNQSPPKEVRDEPDDMDMYIPPEADRGHSEEGGGGGDEY